MIRSCWLLLCLLLSQLVSAQDNWGGGGDDKTLNFGFSFQYIASEFKIFKKANWRDPYYDEQTDSFVTDSLYSIRSPMAIGLGLGFVGDYKLTQRANIRFTPSLSFTDRVLEYQYAPPFDGFDPPQSRQQKVPATMVDLPLAFRVRSDRLGNARAYALFGSKYSIDIVSKKRLDDAGNIPTEKFLKNKRSILSYEAGVGLELYFEWFIMRPELKLSNSFRSVLRREDNPYSSPIDKLFLRTLQFSLLFE
jgi:hypothetical protein